MFRFFNPATHEASSLLLKVSALRNPTKYFTSAFGPSSLLRAGPSAPSLTAAARLTLLGGGDRLPKTNTLLASCTPLRHYAVDPKPSDEPAPAATGDPPAPEVDDEDQFELSNIFTSLRAAPLPAMFLGFGGLVPFTALTGVLLYQQQYIPEVVFAQIAYGATILSFVGGARWGFTIPKTSAAAPSWWNLVYSVTPPGLAWMGLVLPVQEALVTLIFGFSYAALLDVSMTGYPAWFKSMRTLLTTGVVGLLLLSLFGVQD